MEITIRIAAPPPVPMQQTKPIALTMIGICRHCGADVPGASWSQQFACCTRCAGGNRWTQELNEVR